MLFNQLFNFNFHIIHLFGAVFNFAYKVLLMYVIKKLFI